MAMLVTHISAAGGAFMWMLLERINHGKASALGAVTGMVAGLGTITPASGSDATCRSHVVPTAANNPPIHAPASMAAILGLCAWAAAAYASMSLWAQE